MSATNILSACPTEWSVLPVELGKRICSIFEEWSIPFYECLLTWMNIWLSLSGFKVEVLKFLKVSSSQIHLSAWTFIKTFKVLPSIGLGNPVSGYYSIFSLWYTPLGILYVINGLLWYAIRFPYLVIFLELERFAGAFCVGETTYFRSPFHALLCS